jgi:hypothetical protein
MYILTAVAILAAAVSADPVAIEKRADGVTVMKDLSHKWRGTFETPVMWENVDLTNCKQLTDGVESGFEPAWTVLNPLVRKGEGSSGGIQYGVSPKSGVRHMRYAFKESVEVGTVFSAHGGTKPSVLKPDAAYPGDLADDSQWISGVRILADGRGSKDVDEKEISFWAFPVGTKTRALRLSENLDETSGASWQGGRRASIDGIYVFPERVEDIARMASFKATSDERELPKMVNRSMIGWDRWNGFSDKPVSPENPQEIVATWPSPVAFQGVGFNMPGFTDVEIYVCTAPAKTAPNDAKPSQWKLVKKVSGLRCMYPQSFTAAWVDLGETVVTRGLKLKIIAPIVTAFGRKEGVVYEYWEHPHVEGSSDGGKKVFLNGLFILAKSLDPKVKELKAAARKAEAAAKAEAVKGLVPISFEMPYDGFATVVIEDDKGNRVKNLVSDTPFKKGKNTIYWDATDDLGRDHDAAEHGLYNVPESPVAPGTYFARGLTHAKITPVYEFSIYSPGDPPWCTADHKGAWLANHSQPVTACYLPARGKREKGVVALGANITEGPDGLIFVNPDTGVKEGGIKWIGGAWTGANCLAVDTAEGRCARHDYYVGSICWDGHGGYEFRLTALKEDGNEERLALMPLKATDEHGGKPFITGGLAAFGGKVVVALTPHDKLVVYDMPAEPPKELLKPSKEIPLKAPGGVAFGRDGTLFAVGGGKVVKVDLASGMSTPVVASGLEDPTGLAVGADGTIYVADHGSSQQVKVFSADGRLQRAIGKAGACASGKYDPLHMNHPCGLALDEKGRLWVTENDFLPKRTSVWNPKTGAFERAFYGPAKYGAGGTFDTRDDSLFYYDEGNGLMEFKVDWKSGESKLARVLLRADSDSDVQQFATPTKNFAPPQRTIYLPATNAPKGVETVKGEDGKTYRKLLSNSFNSDPVGGAPVAVLCGIRDDRLVPVAAVGHTSMNSSYEGNYTPDLTNAAFKAKWDALRAAGHRDRQGYPYPPALFLWSDLDEDGKYSPDEVELIPGDGWGVAFQDDGSITCNVLMDRQYCPYTPTNNPAVIIRPSRITPSGMPVYEAKAMKTIYMGSTRSPSTGGNQTLVDAEGNAFSTVGVCPLPNYSITGGSNGKPTWSYPNLWPGLHAGHTAPIPDTPGRVTAATRLMGDFIRPIGSKVKPLVGVNGNHGDFYLFTSDGLFAATVFEDARKGKRWDMPSVRRGMDMTGISPCDEHFWPTLNQTKRGTYVVAGKDSSSVVRLDGLDTLRPIARQKLVVTAKTLDEIQKRRDANEAARRLREGTGTLQLALGDAPKLDGDLSDWDAATFVSIEKRGVGAYFNADNKPYDISGALRATKTDLYAAWRTEGVNALAKNSGENTECLFKTGGALDVMLSVEGYGNMRILAAMVDGKPKAMLYMPSVPGTPQDKRVKFSSPVSSIFFDKVEDITDKVELVAGKDQKGWEANYELRIPLSLLKLKPLRGKKMKGDIGVLRGQNGATVARVYWSNKATAIVSDVPSEAALAPQNWGDIEMK